jgi:hypothetical protein
MKFARIVFGVAAVYGFLVLAPLYFLLDRLGRDVPPAVTHPEFYYGFTGLALVAQVLFILIAANPIRYRPIMLVSVLEKVAYTLPVVLLYRAGQVPRQTLLPSLVDPILGLLFLVAYLRTPAVKLVPISTRD